MSHRLNIELTAGDAVLASCYYHGCAFTDQALDLAEVIAKTYDETFGDAEPDIFTAVTLLEKLGSGVSGVERNRILKDERYFGMDFAPARSMYDGVIAVTEEGIRENRRWENGRIRIDLEGRTLDFHVHYYTYMEDYLDFTTRVPDCMDWDELPQIDAGADIFTGIYFDHIDMVRRIIEGCPNGLRLRNGDVVEWI